MKKVFLLTLMIFCIACSKNEEAAREAVSTSGLSCGDTLRVCDLTVNAQPGSGANLYNRSLGGRHTTNLGFPSQFIITFDRSIDVSTLTDIDIDSNFLTGDTQYEWSSDRKELTITAPETGAGWLTGQGRQLTIRNIRPENPQSFIFYFNIYNL